MLFHVLKQVFFIFADKKRSDLRRSVLNVFTTE